MDDRSYVDAAVPEPFTVLGLRLRPLSIGHILLLHRLESPFVVADSPPITIGDLAIACLICSKTFAEGVALLDDESLPRSLHQWGLYTTNQHGWRRFCPWLYRQIDLKSKMDLFSDYLKYHFETPTYSVEDGKARGINAPAWQVIRVVLLSKTNLTETEIFDRPYRLCIADFLTLRAIEGQLNFEDQSELEEAQRQANEFAASLKEKGNA